METPPSNPGALKALLILHKGLLLGQVIFALVAFYLVYTNTFGGAYSYDKILQVIALVFSVACFYSGSYVFKKKLFQARESEESAGKKFAVYRSASILQWALLEGPCLFVIICFFLTGNYAFFALAAVLILLFTMMAPSRLKIVLQLQLSEEEMAEL